MFHRLRIGGGSGSCYRPRTACEAASIRPVDSVFRALADPTRRTLLDALFQRDGQTLLELRAPLVMTRHGVMKHLCILESAALVTTRRVGRFTHHYLNPVPIRQVHDRWVGKFAEPIVAGMVALVRELESPMPRPAHVYEIHIRTTPELLWSAFTDGARTRRYFFGAAIESTWTIGASVRWRMPDGSIAVEGEVLAFEPPRKLAETWSAKWSPDVASDPPTRVTWEIEALGEVCKLTVTHDGFERETATEKQVSHGWHPLLSSLNTLLETGSPLPLPGLDAAARP